VPLSAARMVAGHNAFADRIPVKRTHSTMLWPNWGVPITGSTGLHYLLSALPNRLFLPLRGLPARHYLASATGSR
jgi:hypothetical protein